jgi:two-component system sensor histidine kinase PilS (NtrC family)
MQDGGSDEEQTARLMAIVGKEIDRLNNLITEFLDFAKPEAPLEDHVDMGDLVSEILDFVKNDSQRKSVGGSAEIENGHIVLANRNKLKQAFLNIIVNAFQASENEAKPEVDVVVKKSGSVVVVSIKDNGIGMSEKLKQRIFEPFHTTKHKGTGLGLAITHTILEAHQANLSVESEEGVGTEFRMEFPLV